MRCLLALGVPGVHLLASASGTARCSREALSTTLCVTSRTGSAASSGRRGWRRSDDSGHSGRSGRSRRSWGWGSGNLLLGGGCAATTGSALPDSWAGHGESLAAVVDAEVGVGVGCLVCAGELDQGAGCAAATTLDLDLHARDVVLGLVDVGAVNTNVLNADEVLSVGSVLGDLGGNEVAVVVAPGGGGEVAAIADALLEDLEPATRSVVGSGTGRCLGHVDQTGTGVPHLGVQGEFDLVTGVDSQGLSLATSGAALVANNVRTVGKRSIADIGFRVGRELDGVVLGRAGRRADVLELPLLDTSNHVVVEEVVGSGHLGDGGDDKSRELHPDWQ
jgi:hypothetical protein